MSGDTGAKHCLYSHVANCDCITDLFSVHSPQTAVGLTLFTSFLEANEPLVL